MKNYFYKNFSVNAIVTPILYLSLLFLGKITATELVILYAVETIVIGFFHLIKLLVITFSNSKDSKQKLLGLFYTVFFSFHYGVFVFVQTTFFFVFLSMEDPRISSDIGFENFSTIFRFEGFQLGFAFLFISYLIRFFLHFLRSGYCKTLRPESYIFQPYLRIFIQQFVAIIPGFFIIFGRAGFVAGVLLIIIRGITDYFMNRMRTDELYFEKVCNFLYKQKKGEAMEEKDKTEAADFLRMVVGE